MSMHPFSHICKVFPSLGVSMTSYFFNIAIFRFSAILGIMEMQSLSES